MKKVLIISYHFPPSTAVGSLRIQGLAKFLPDFGWEPTILTAKLSNVSEAHTDMRVRLIETPYEDLLITWKKKLGLKLDKTVEEQFGSPTYKNKKMIMDIILNCWEEIFAYPDANKGWYKFAVEAGDKLLQEGNFDAIISSSSPATPHIIAKELKIKYNMPWIADLRDLWTQNHYYHYSFMRKLIERRLEVRTLCLADALVTVSQPLAKKLKKLHKGKRIYAIPNGFDPDEKKVDTLLSDKFSIVYTGSLYQGKRNPEPLFAALRELILEGNIDSNDITVDFYGPKEDWLENDIKRYGLQDIVNEYGGISRDFALEKQRETQVLLLLLWDHPEEIGVYTGKIFEYLAAQRPILAIGGPEGVVKDLLAETNAGVYATSVDDVKKALEEYYNEYKRKGNIEYKGERAKIDKYSQREMARKFAAVLGTLTRK